jgi:hypothetical protein
MQTRILGIGFFTVHLQRAGALLPAVLCSAVPLEPQDLCGVDDIGR